MKRAPTTSQLAEDLLLVEEQIADLTARHRGIARELLRRAARPSVEQRFAWLDWRRLRSEVAAADAAEAHLDALAGGIIAEIRNPEPPSP